MLCGIVCLYRTVMHYGNQLDAGKALGDWRSKRQQGNATYFVTCQKAPGFLGCRTIPSSFPPRMAGKAGTEPWKANSRRLRPVPNPLEASLEARGFLARNKIWVVFLLPCAAPLPLGFPCIQRPGSHKYNILSELLPAVCPRGFFGI